MDKLNNRRDHTEKQVNATGKSDSERWKRSSLYAMPTDKPRPESTSETARERTSDSRDRPAYRDGKLLLAQQRQQAYQKDSSITPNLSASSISRSRRLGSDVKHEPNARKSNPGELGVPKGGGEDESTSQQQGGRKWSERVFANAVYEDAMQQMVDRGDEWWSKEFRDRSREANDRVRQQQQQRRNIELNDRVRQQQQRRNEMGL